MDYHYRHTKIIFTIGPSTESEYMLEALMKQHVDICRINMAHADHEWTLATIKRIRKVGEHVGRHIAIMMDVKGPEIRTSFIEGKWELEKDEYIDFYMDPHKEVPLEDGTRGVSVNYPGLIDDVQEGDVILVDSGLIHLHAVAKRDGVLRCRVDIPGTFSSCRHINLPGIKANLPALTEKDKKDIELGISEEIAFFALSFVREAQDVVKLKEFLKNKGSEARVISKIEDQCGIRNIDAIIDKSDGIMVARGDLGIECPFENVPIIQRDIIDACISQAKPVIVATHMLESMIHSPIPTRAEVSDVSNAIFQRADAVMLSGETTIGKYPEKCIQAMRKIILKVENHVSSGFNEDITLISPKNKMLKSAVVLAQELDHSGIVVFTTSGSSAQKIAALRASRCPLYVFTDSFILTKQLRLIWGVEPFQIDFLPDRNETIAQAFDTLKQRGSIKEGDLIIVLTNTIINEKTVDTIQLRKID